jgi:hypothetical protein
MGAVERWEFHGIADEENGLYMSVLLQSITWKEDLIVEDPVLVSLVCLELHCEPSKVPDCVC